MCFFITIGFPQKQDKHLAAGAVAVVVHWYNGDVEGERLSLECGSECDWDQLGARAASLEEDTMLFANLPRPKTTRRQV